MTKTLATDASPPSTEPSTPEAAIPQSFWLLKEGTAPKLGARAEGSISYNVLACKERRRLFIAITGNKGGGYFSKEHISISKIEACLGSSSPTKPSPSKTFKEAFISRSSNNAGFLAAVLRHEGLLAAAPGAETQHVHSGEWAAWKKTMLAEAGQLIEAGIEDADKKSLRNELVQSPTEHKKTLPLPGKQ